MSRLTAVTDSNWSNERQAENVKLAATIQTTDSLYGVFLLQNYKTSSEHGSRDEKQWISDAVSLD